MLSNEYLVAKFGFDTEENEPLKVWGVIQFIIQSSPNRGDRRDQAWRGLDGTPDVRGAHLGWKVESALGL